MNERVPTYEDGAFGAMVLLNLISICVHTENRVPIHLKDLVVISPVLATCTLLFEEHTVVSWRIVLLTVLFFNTISMMRYGISEWINFLIPPILTTFIAFSVSDKLHNNPLVPETLLCCNLCLIIFMELLFVSERQRNTDQEIAPRRNNAFQEFIRKCAH